MGGTSTDVCLVRDLTPLATSDGMVGAFPVKVPQIDMHTVGAGGGSLAWLDLDGSLQVGPRSAGAVPGPAAYGLGGTEPTVTDANVVLGRIGTTRRLGGSITIDATSRAQAVADLAARMGSVHDGGRAGRGRRAHRRGPHDLRHPRDLHPARPRPARLHAGRLRRRRARCTRWPWPTRSASRACWCRAIRATSRRSACSPPTSSTTRSAPAWGRCASAGRCSPACSPRWRPACAASSSSKASTPRSSACGARSTCATAARPSSSIWRPTPSRLWPPSRPPSTSATRRCTATPTPRRRSSWSTRASAPTAWWPSRPRPAPDATRTSLDAALIERRPVRFDGAAHDCPVWERERLPADAELSGPCIVEEFGATTVVPPGWRGALDAHGNLRFERS